MKKSVIYSAISLLMSCQYGINSETSEIGSINATCLDAQAWEMVCKENTIDSIVDPSWLQGLEKVENHFIKPEYVLYFNEEPKEIVGCDAYTIRVVYNETISNQTLTGQSPQLSNKEQKRIRNRVLGALMNYQCDSGKAKTLEQMKKPVPFHDAHEKYGNE